MNIITLSDAAFRLFTLRRLLEPRLIYQVSKAYASK